MKKLALTLALSAFALLSTTAANAQATRFSYVVGGNNVLSYPAVIDQSAVIGGGCGIPACATPLSCAPLFGKHTYWDNGLGRRNAGLLGGMFGGLFGGGLLGYGAPAVAPVAYGGYGYGGYGLNSYAAVIPNNGCATAIPPVCGQRLANSLFDIRVFRFGFGFGRVSPRFDARPAGWAI